MGLSQPDLAREFQNGRTSGQASNVSIRETDDETLLVGYGWAVYAARDKETGEITYYKGWYGYSTSTSGALTKMGLSVRADNVVDDRRQV